jgi:plastocyanin
LWDTGNMNPGTSKTTTFNTAGPFGFHCTYHAAMGMTGTITVH